MATDEDWTPPTSMAAAKARMRELIGEIQDIEAQLGDPGHPKHPLQSDDPDAFWDWRRGAKWARTRRLQDLRLVKDWIRDNRETRP